MKLSLNIPRDALTSLIQTLPSGHCDIRTLTAIVKNAATHKHVGDTVTSRSTYEYGRGLTFGRMYAPIQTLSAPTRGHLLWNHYYDMDIVACHPVMLLHAFEQAGIASPRLCEYLLDRETIIKGVIEQHPTLDRSKVKKAYNVALYLGGYKKHATGRIHVKALERFTREMRENAKQLAGMPEHAATYALAKKRKDKDKSPLGTFISYVCQQWEEKCINEFRSFLDTEKAVVGILMHDGLMVEKSSVSDLDVLLAGANTYLKTLGIKHLRVTHKPMASMSAHPDLGKYNLILDTKKQAVQLVLFNAESAKAHKSDLKRLRSVGVRVGIYTHKHRSRLQLRQLETVCDVPKSDIVLDREQCFYSTKHEYSGSDRRNGQGLRVPESHDVQHRQSGLERP